MARRTTVIDIGSNSLTMVIYERSSRFAFHLVEKIRSKVRLGEGSYKKGGFLQEIPMQRAKDALREYMSIANDYKCKKVLCVATSALRDAPNKKEFINKIKKELKLNIKIIDGEKEAHLGALAAINLLPKVSDAVTIDIGGGSTELAKIENSKIVDKISLNLGAVRLKELFFDNSKSFEELEEYIKKEISKIPKNFSSNLIIGIGGSIRALSLAIMQKNNYPLKSLQGYRYNIEKNSDFIDSLIKSDIKDLHKFHIKENRQDNIREGVTLFKLLAKYLKSKDVMVSKVGVREGVYLSDILRNSNYKFPENFNTSVRSLIDRYAIQPKNGRYIQKISIRLFELLKKELPYIEPYKKELSYAAKLSLISKRLDMYSKSSHNFYFLLENLNFSLSHEEKVLIAVIINDDIRNLERYEDILPEKDIVLWLNFILELSLCINIAHTREDIGLKFDGNRLDIISSSKMHLAKEYLPKPPNNSIVVSILSDSFM